MKKLMFLLLMLLVSCSTVLTEGGRRVVLVTNNQKEKYCVFLDIITTSNDMGVDSAHDRENALNDARNKVFELGGNAMRIISNSNENEGYFLYGGMLMGASEAVVQVEALMCDFNNK